MKLHRDLGITKKSAWRLAHRIREVDEAAAAYHNMVGKRIRYCGLIMDNDLILGARA